MKATDSAILMMDGDGFKELVKARCIKEEIDFSHFITRSKPFIKPDGAIEIKGSTSSTIKKKLFKEKILEEKCYCCGLGNEWQGKPLVLQLEHIDGNHYNNDISNLTILCPNCHSQTSTWCGRNVDLNKCICGLVIKLNTTRCEDCIDKTPDDFIPKCVDCSKQVSRGSTRCLSCSGKPNRPSLEELEKDLKIMR